jgi:hypothetical protein|uniref:Uncharacterized protein n=1 Tax=Sipha flava TaxID=143950 RepID=A0A2S2R753_9HEMI
MRITVGRTCAKDVNEVSFRINTKATPSLGIGRKMFSFHGRTSITILNTNIEYTSKRIIRKSLYIVNIYITVYYIHLCICIRFFSFFSLGLLHSYVINTALLHTNYEFKS